MKRSMLDILACPIDKSYPLELFAVSEARDVVSEGALYCAKCSRFYPIIEEIPIMLPDELRDREMEEGFLKRNRDALPGKIVSAASPWHL